MWLSWLEIEAIRNISRAELSPANGYNLITGNNGSGKSSILEAVQCLSTGKSFRTSRKQPLIKDGAQHAIIYGQISTLSARHSAGVMKQLDGSSVARLDGRNLEGQVELAALLPIIGTSPESEDIIGEGSKLRQAYLDWTLFHVEPNFRACWRNYRRTLAQRNSALRNKLAPESITIWDVALASLGEQINQWRVVCFSRLYKLIRTWLVELLPNTEITFSYRQGWPKDQTLQQSLANALEIDRKMGFTHFGPHRADIVMRGTSGVISNTLSRGQRKVAAIVLRLCQAADYKALTGESPIVYVDDLPSELDRDNRDKVLAALLSLDSQLFVTAINSSDMPLHDFPPLALFHVEQGVVTNVV